MSEHHRGAWGSREEAVWWPAGGIAQDQQTMHHQQQLINQHQQQQQQHQQLVQQHQIQHQVVQQTPQGQHNEIARSNNSNVPGQQIFSYKMASSFQNPSGGVTVATTNAGAYDYRLNMTPGAANAAAPGTQWWYTTGQNVEQVHQQTNQAHQQTNQHQQQTNQHSQAVCVVLLIYRFFRK